MIYEIFFIGICALIVVGFSLARKLLQIQRQSERQYNELVFAIMTGVNNGDKNGT